MKNKYYNDQDNYYPSMVDMMAGILFIMIILLMGFVIEEKVQSKNSSHEQVEHKIDHLKNLLLKQLSDYLTKKDIINHIYPEENAIIISAKQVFVDNEVELTKEAKKTYAALSRGVNQVIQSEEGKESLSNGYLDKIYVEVHSMSQLSSIADDLLTWGRTIGFYGAFLTANQNSQANQLIGLKNKNGHQMIAIRNFTNQWSILNDYIIQRSPKVSLQKKMYNTYIIIRFSMKYPTSIN